MKISRTNSEMQPTKQPNEIESTSPRWNLGEFYGLS